MIKTKEQLKKSYSRANLLYGTESGRIKDKIKATNKKERAILVIVVGWLSVYREGGRCCRLTD